MITVYTTKTCAYCPMVKKYLTLKNKQYKEIDVSDDTEIRMDLYKKTGYMTVPVSTDGNKYVIGFKPAELNTL